MTLASSNTQVCKTTQNANGAITNVRTHFSLPKSSAKIQYTQFIAPEQAGNELFCSGTSWEWANWSAPHWNMVPEHTVTVSQWSQFQSGDFIADLNRSGPGKMKPIWSDQFWWIITTSNWTRTTFGFRHWILHVAISRFDSDLKLCRFRIPKTHISAQSQM